MIDDQIQSLDDARAIRVLRVLAEVRERSGSGLETSWSPEVERALVVAFPGEASEARLSDGELARQALRLLARFDPITRGPIQALITGPSADAFALEAPGAVRLYALLAIQAALSFEPSGSGLVARVRGPEDAGLRAVVSTLLGPAQKPRAPVSWEERNERRHFLIDKKYDDPEGLTLAEAAELEQLQNEADDHIVPPSYEPFRALEEYAAQQGFLPPDFPRRFGNKD